MTKEEMLKIMRTLSALESQLMWKITNKEVVPDYLLEDIARDVSVLEREILK